MIWQISDWESALCGRGTGGTQLGFPRPGSGAERPEIESKGTGAERPKIESRGTGAQRPENHAGARPILKRQTCPPAPMHSTSSTG